MNWKEKLTGLEHSKDYKSAIKHIQSAIRDNPEDVEAYIRGIYLLHNVLVEEDYSDLDHDFLANLLKSLFSVSYEKFSNNAEYLFFIGKILYIAEWYFGVDDDFKPTEEKQALQMQRKAYEMERNNILYEWAWRFSLGERSSSNLSEQILTQDEPTLEWLKSKGFPGEYILEALEQNRKQESKNFDVIAKEQFKFLESDFGFQLSKSEKEDWGYELVYLSQKTGVKITYEFREAYIFIMLYRLVDGNLQENPRNIQENTALYGYELDDIISLRNSEALIKPAYEYGEESAYYDKQKGLTLYVTAFAQNLKEYASDVLSGDFKIFDEADRIVKERAKKHK